MKKTFNYAFALLLGAALTLSCAREVLISDNVEGAPVGEKIVTLSATLPEELLTKVSFTPGYDAKFRPTGLALAWEEGDKIRIYDADDHSRYSDFRLSPECAGLQSGTFKGAELVASSYDAEVFNGEFSYNDQHQPSDGVTTGLKYLASAEGLADYASITFTDFSSVLAVTAKMPEGAAAGVKSVELIASADIFNGTNTLKVTFDTVGDADNDNHLHFFATLPKGDQGVLAGTSVIAKFAAPGTGHTMYTRYLELGTQTFTNQSVNAINIDATHSASYANASLTDIGTSTNPYLIGDGYQLASVNGLALGDQTTYFKMIDDVDMTGITHNCINTNSGYTQVVNFDGNDKTISHLGKKLFYVFKGSIRDLTLDQCALTSDRAIFADYVQGTGHSISNVDITNCSFSRGVEKVGALIGIVNNGTAGTTSITISDCDVVNTNITVPDTKGNVGGLIGYCDAKVEISDCIVGKNDANTYTISGTAANVGGFIGQMTANAGGSTVSDCTVADVDITSNSTNVGGFIGYIAPAAVTVDGCSYDGGTVTGGNYSGGFVGHVGNGAVTLSDNASSGTVSASSSIAGFAGAVEGGTLTGNTTSCTISGVTNVGAFIGAANGGTIQKCSSTGTTVSASGNVCGGFIGVAHATSALAVSDCYSTTNMSGSKTRKRGGMIGLADSGTITLERCYATGNIDANFELGGLVGAASVATFTMNDCAAWNGSIVAGNKTATSWSSGAIIGITHPNCHASNNYRSPDMTLTAYCVPAADFDQPDIDGTTTPLYWVSSDDQFTWSYCDLTSAPVAGEGNCYAARWAYHGKHVAAGTTLSQLASTTLGWDAAVWDFSGALPVLR